MAGRPTQPGSPAAPGVVAGPASVGGEPGGPEKPGGWGPPGGPPDSPPGDPGGPLAAVSGRRPICSSCGPGGSVIPSTTTWVTSGAASCTAPSMASRTVTVEDGQPWQLPSSRRCATPSGPVPRYSTPPACDPR